MGSAAGIFDAVRTAPHPGAIWDPDLKEIAKWLATWQDCERHRVERPRIAVFAGAHGIAARRLGLSGRSNSAHVPPTFLTAVGGEELSALVVPLLEAAAWHDGMATFSEAEVSSKET